MVIKKCYAIFILAVFLVQFGWSQTVVPRWFLEPSADDLYYYGVGVSDMNGSIEERQQQSLHRAIINLAMLREHSNQSMHKSFFESSASDTYEQETTTVIKVTIEAVPSQDEVEVTRRWRERDGHLYTEVRLSKAAAASTSSSGLLKYYHLSRFRNEEIIKEEISYSAAGRIGRHSFFENYVVGEDQTGLENIYCEYMPEFLTWFGTEKMPDWFINTPTDESAGLNSVSVAYAANLHLAMQFALLKGLQDIANQHERKISEIAKKYPAEPVSQDPSNAISREINTQQLKNMQVKQRSIGISPDKRFAAYVQLEMPFNE